MKSYSIVTLLKINMRLGETVCYVSFSFSLSLTKKPMHTNNIDNVIDQ